MPRFKLVDYSPRLLAVDLSRQLLPGTFEYALHHLLDHEIDVAEIESRYSNDEVGASAYDPPDLKPRWSTRVMATKRLQVTPTVDDLA